jgi:N-acetylglucosamine-6-phosphate deacetylase
MRSEHNPVLLRATRVVTPHGTLENATVVIDDGLITKIVQREGDEANRAGIARELDGLTLVPGLIDVHLHGAMGVDTMEATAEDLHRVSLFLASRGVTSWLPTLVPGPDEDYKRVVDAVGQLMREQAGRPAAARALGVHYEGPFINSAQCGALRPPYFRVFNTSNDLAALATVNESGAVRMTTVAPEIEGGLDLVAELSRQGWVVSIGHTRATPEVLDQACTAGARHMTHFMNAMAPLHHRAPGPIGWGLMRDDVTCDVIADGVHTDPLMLRLALRCKTAGRLALISDAVAPAGMGDGEYRIWGEQISVTNGRTRNERGSIAGSVIMMDDAVRMMLALGTSIEDATKMAASNPAKLLGVERLYGSIEEGKRADIVALDKEGRVKLTLVGGRVAYDAEQAGGSTGN